MIAEINILGVFFSGALAAAFLAGIALLILRRILRWVGFYRLVWHRGLVDLALFTILWSLSATVLPVLSGAITWRH